MIIVLIILSTIFLILLWVLFIPFSIIINTHKNLYKLHLPVLFSLKALKKEDQWQLEGRLLFIRFNPLKKKNIEKKKEQKKKSKKMQILKIPEFFKEMISTLKKIFRSLSIKKFHMDIDTGDYAINAQLYPVVLLIGANYNNININFKNQNSLNLKITGQLYILLYHSMVLYIKTKKLFT